MCGCNLSLIRVIGLGPAGDFDYSQEAVEAERLETLASDLLDVAGFEQGPHDWATYRKDYTRSSRSEQDVAKAITLQWEYVPEHSFACTAPVAVGESVFVAASDGVVRALDAANGRIVWSAYTGGAVRVPPTIANGRVFVGSADGFVHVFEAASGRPLWRFRAAPIQRKVPVYGSLSSTWPVGSGVLVSDGVAYAAAGIANYDGTHVTRTRRCWWVAMTCVGPRAFKGSNSEMRLPRSRIACPGSIAESGIWATSWILPTIGQDSDGSS
jgi:hypothetical protein